MRTYGRIAVVSGIDASTTTITSDTTDVTADNSPEPSWVEVQTDAAGNNDMVYVTTLIQVLLLNLGESPFFAAFGIPAIQSVLQQVAPDFYVALTQQIFASQFAQLLIQKALGARDPTYNVSVMTHQGVKLNAAVPIPY